MSSLLLFDAANGFRLLDKTLPEDIEKAADAALEEIKTALAKSKRAFKKDFVTFF